MSLYLDNASTTYIEQSIIDEMLPFYNTYFHNASNFLNREAQFIRSAIEKASVDIIKSLHAEDYNLIFTSGATESLNSSLKSLFFQFGTIRPEIITAKTEHKAVLLVCDFLESLGAEITFLSTNKNGEINYSELETCISEKTLAVALMGVNNETGVVHDLCQIAILCQQYSIPFICDATQMIGKLPINLNNNSPDYVIGSAHKIHGPKGAGILLIKKNQNFLPLIHGGGQQQNLRSGTLNTPAIIGTGLAIKMLISDLDENISRISSITKSFENKLKKTKRLEIISENVSRSPYISCIKANCIDIDKLTLLLKPNISFSINSACNSEIEEPSHVLTAMGFEKEDAQNCFRLSYSPYTTISDLDKAAELIIEALNHV